MHKEYRFKKPLNETQSKYLLTFLLGFYRDDKVIICPKCEFVHGVVCDEKTIAAFQKKFPHVKVFQVQGA